MTGREFAKVWALAFSLVAAAVVFLTTAEWMFDRELLKGPIVAIGSSLTAHAIPARSPDSKGLLGDGRAHARFYKNLISEDETNLLVSKAVGAGASTVLVEVNTFAFDLAFTVGAGDDPWIITASKALAGRANQLRSNFKWLLGYQALDPLREPETLNSELVIRAADLAVNYPLHLRPPRDPRAIAEALSAARQRGAEVILIALPRSRSAVDYMGEEAQIALVTHLEALAKDLGAPLFLSSAAWPDEYFVDTAHLNARGRARFVAELSAWWTGRAWRPRP